MHSTAYCKSLFSRVISSAGLHPKTWLIMRLTAFLLLVFTFHVSANTYSQSLTLNMKNAPLIKVLNEVKKQSGFYLVYTKGEMLKATNVNISLTNAPLESALSEIFKGQPLTYKVNDKFIMISPKPAKPQPLQASGSTGFLPESPELLAKDTFTITGLVIDDENRTPLEGATVKEKDGTAVTTTNKDGFFKFTVSDANASLVISFVGYVNSIIKAAPSVGVIKLKLNNSPLNEIQVIAYGTQSKRFSVGAVSTVSAETISRQPVTNPLLALQGQAPGLIINSFSGAPGAKVYVQIRGQNSFANTATGSKPYDQPLFIIDGVPFARQNNNLNQLANLASTGTAGGGLDQGGGISPFNSINPDDIESISVLKDAEATSIYGSEGSNGVILITTKKGRAGKTTFSTSVNTQSSSSTRPVKLLNTQQYIQFRKDAFAADGLTPTTITSPELTVFDQTKYTNWQDIIFGKTTTNTTVNSTLQGGSGSNTFLVSAGYNKSNVNFAGDYSNQRFTINTAFHNTSNDKRFDFDLKTRYGYTTNNAPNGAINPIQVLLPPNSPDLINADGSLNWVYQGITLTNFYSYLETYATFQNHDFMSSMQLSYKLVKGLTFKTALGYNRNTTIENSAVPISSRNPNTAPTSTATFANSLAESINIEPQLTYTNTIGKGTLTVLVGGTYRKNKGYSAFITGSGYSNDNLLGSINGATTKAVNDANSIRRYAAVFGRINYNYAERYIVSLTGRRDGSSNFGPGHQYGNFGSVGGAWIFSEEKPVKSLVTFMSFGKLSASYGTTGSDGVAPYLYQTFWGVGLASSPTFQGSLPTYPGNLYNPNYSWALKKSLNLALDLGFFKDRILLNATYYRNRTGNQLASSPLPNQTGFTSVVENVDATVQNTGWEFGLVTKNIQSRFFTWESNFNISFNRNILLSFANLASSVSYRNSYVIGAPISMVPNIYRYAGIDPATGVAQIYDRNGAITKTPANGYPAGGGDWITNVNRDVDYSGGLNNSLTYKRFRFDFMLQFSSQTSPNWIRTLYQTNRIGLQPYNVPAAVMGNYWKKAGDMARFQRLTTLSSSPQGQAFTFMSSSDAAYEKAKYVRLKTLSVSYNLPESWIKKIGMKAGNFYMNAQNLFTITNVELGDPESAGNYTSIPLQRIIAIGANFTF